MAPKTPRAAKSPRRAASPKPPATKEPKQEEAPAESEQAAEAPVRKGVAEIVALVDDHRQPRQPRLVVPLRVCGGDALPFQWRSQKAGSLGR